MKIKADITLTSAELMNILKEKYPDLEINWIWFSLEETKEHWESANDKKFKDLRAMPELKKQHIRIWSDGSFDMGSKE
jgi:uncharacterized phage-like protein YoqJ